MEQSLTIQENNLPRKVLMFLAYIDFIDENPVRSLIGVGPGGYNGRVAFLLNKESHNPFTKILGHHMPYYHENNAFVFWNKDVADFESFTDGARNKPFSSLVSIASEFGIIFFLIFCFYFLRCIFVFYKKGKQNAYYLFLFWANIFVFSLFAVDMWIESSEFLYFLLFQYLIKIKIQYDSSI